MAETANNLRHSSDVSICNQAITATGAGITGVLS